MATKSAISFGLVHIPISLHTATQDVDVHFNQLHKEDNSRIRYKKSCAHCGKEITIGDIVKGFEYDKDQYVIVTPDDFEKIKTEKDRTMQILQDPYPGVPGTPGYSQAGQGPLHPGRGAVRAGGSQSQLHGNAAPLPDE